VEHKRIGFVLRLSSSAKEVFAPLLLSTRRRSNRSRAIFTLIYDFLPRRKKFSGSSRFFSIKAAIPGNRSFGNHSARLTKPLVPISLASDQPVFVGSLGADSVTFGKLRTFDFDCLGVHYLAFQTIPGFRCCCYLSINKYKNIKWVLLKSTSFFAW
jgi:hypothetical protein